MKLQTLTLAAAVALTAGAASANGFGFQEVVEDRNTIELNLVTAAADGVIEVYDLKAGQQGMLLGTTQIAAGANSDVRVNIGGGYHTDLLAVLTIDGQPVASEAFDVLR